MSEGTRTPDSGRTPTGTRASDLAIDLPAPASRPSADSIRVHPDSPAAASRITSRAALPPVHPCPLNIAAPPRRECARRGLDPIPPPNREDRTMTETVDQAQAQLPRALAGIIEDALRSPSSRLAISKDREAAASLTATRRTPAKQSHQYRLPIRHFRGREPRDARLDDTSSATPVKLTVRPQRFAGPVRCWRPGWGTAAAGAGQIASRGTGASSWQVKMASCLITF